LKRTGSKGWIRLFLFLQTSNAVRIKLDMERPFGDLNPALEAICQAAVRSSMASHKKWFDMTPPQAHALLESVMSNIRQNSCLAMSRAI
jgi:hypothetical protein